MDTTQIFSLSRLRHERNPYNVVVFNIEFQIAGCIGSSLFTGVFPMFATTSLDMAFIASVALVITLAVAGFCIAFYLGSCRHISHRNAGKSPRSVGYLVGHAYRRPQHSNDRQPV